jgi:AcrR family transcriptional regulator
VSPTATKNRGGRLAAVDRREQILDAARQVFIESGLAGARVREISAVAGINEALLYRHFASKDEMFEAAIAEPLEAGVSGLLEMAGDAESYVGKGEAHREWVTRLYDHLLDVMVDLIPLLGVVLFADPERGQAFYKNHFAPALDAIAAAIAGTDPLWDHRDFDPRMVAAAALGTATMLALDERFGGSLLADRDEALRSLTDNLFDGIAPR